MTTAFFTSNIKVTLLLATLIHAVLMLGLSFGLENKPPPPKTLEVTLATYKSQKKPNEADYLAQLNQQGSGTLEDKAVPTTNVEADFQGNEINEVSLETQEASRPDAVGKKTSQVVTQASSRKKVYLIESVTPTLPQEPSDKNESRQEIDYSEEIASLEAQFSEQRQAYAKRPRIKRLTAASTMQEPGAAYKNEWRKKVEKIGNLNYPSKARELSLYGELRLMVAIRKDGTLADIEVLQSSGYTILDDAALRIVRMASPYQPFDNDLKDFDLVEIIRTWRFEKGDRLFSH